MTSGTRRNFFTSGAFGQFMASPMGRWTRIVAGVVLIALGIVMGGWAYLLAVIGLVPLLAGIFDKCVFSALFGGPFGGDEIRALGR